MAQDSAKETGRTAEEYLIGAGGEGWAYRRNKTPGAECTQNKDCRIKEGSDYRD